MLALRQATVLIHDALNCNHCREEAVCDQNCALSLLSRLTAGRTDQLEQKWWKGRELDSLTGKNVSKPLALVR